MLHSPLSLLAAVVVTTAARAQSAPIPPLDDARFAELQRALRPDPDAPWRTIAWRTDLLAAQREAAATDAPLFVWAMDGHPLGCT